jgi:hypothetical protein
MNENIALYILYIDPAKIDVDKFLEILRKITLIIKKIRFKNSQSNKCIYNIISFINILYLFNYLY